MLSTDEDERAYGRAITSSACEDEGGEWVEFISFLEVLEDVTSEAACRAEQNKGTRNKIFWTKLRVGDLQDSLATFLISTVVQLRKGDVLSTGCDDVAIGDKKLVHIFLNYKKCTMFYFFY